MARFEEGLLYIDGQRTRARSGATFDVIDPGTQEVIAQAANAGVEDLDAAVSAARRAFDTTDWSTNHGFRQHCLRQLREGLLKHQAEFEDIVMAEAGICRRYLGTHVGNQIQEMAWIIDLVGTFEWERELPVHRAGAFSSRRTVVQEAYGVGGAITAWNGPFAQNLWKTTHLLGAGNTMVLKTAPPTPLTGALLAQVVDRYTDIPAGVFNVIGSGDVAGVGEALTADPRVDIYHFTGSVGVGQRIVEKAARGIRKVVLELGGKSANILLDDADLDEAVPASVMRCMSSSGQGCALPTRMVVHASLYDEVAERLVGLMQQVKLGDQRDPDTAVGPMIRASQVDRMAGLVERARADGATVAVGGRRADRGGEGFWFEPTLILGAGENSEIAQTEVFGPVLTVLRYDGDDDEAVRVANNSRFGLAGYVQTRDLARGEAVARKLQAGIVSVGASSAFGPDSPFGGYRSSGMGREHGIEGFRECVQSKTIASPAAGKI